MFVKYLIYFEKLIFTKYFSSMQFPHILTFKKNIVIIVEEQ
jgi:hypothetical protein